MGTLRIHGSFLRKGVLLFLISGFAITLAFSQQKTITGTVSSKTEGPLIGVYVVIQGTTQGTTTDVNGNYSLSVPGPQAVLVYTYIGYVSQSIPVGTQTKIDVVLEPAVSALAEIVVTGYGTQARREITSSIASVKSDEFNKGNVQNPVQLIQGKVSGLSISKPGGDPNGSFDIRLRGLSTIGANLGPLVVIDGIVGGSLENVDPNDIESINVLKDGSAAAIYGSRASSGVILVTTKKGKKGNFTVDYNVYETLEMVAKNTPVMNAAEWRALKKEINEADTNTIGTDFGKSTDWFKAIEQDAWSQVHNLSFSGGADKTTYRLAFNYHNSEGVMIKTGFHQLNGRLNLTQKALNDKMTFDLTLGATQKDFRPGFNSAFRYATIFNPTAPVRSTDPQYDQYNGYFQQVLFDYYNPVSILEQNVNDATDRLVEFALKGTYEIVKGLSIDAFYSRLSNASLNSVYNGKRDYWGGMNRNGLASRGSDNSVTQLFESTAHYTGDITSRASITALVGYSYQDFINDGFYAQGGDFLTDDFNYNNLAAALDFKNGKGTITSYKNSNKLIAFFSRVNLNFHDLWFVTGSARYEGSSRFGSANKWGLFPSIGAGIDISKILNAPAIDNLKIRASYGITGNQPASSYLSLLTMGPSGNFLYNSNFIPVYAPTSNANPDLKWEKKAEADAGIDFSFYKSRLSGSFDFYTRTTTDLLFQYQVPVPPNLFTSAWLNLGKIRSSGLELTLTWNAVQKKDFTYSLTLTPSYIIENTLVSLSGSFNGADLKYGTQDLGDMGSPGQNQVPLTRVQEGKPIGQLLTLVFKEIDQNGNFVFVDENKDGKIDQADRAIVGNGLPKFLIGWGNTFSYKNWDLNIFFRGVFGHDLINSFRGFYEVPNYITSYNLPKSVTKLRNAQTGKLLNVSSGTLSSKDVEHADFVSLDNASLGYSFNLPKGGVFSKIRLYIGANRLFYITGYQGVDPEPRYVDSDTGLGTYNNPLVPGVDRRDTWFRTRSFSFGANIVF